MNLGSTQDSAFIQYALPLHTDRNKFKPMNHKDSRKTVLITGCSSGIGLATASFLQKQGFEVITSARKEHDVRALQEQGFSAVKLDLSESQSVTQGFEAAMSLCDGKIYGLFNNGAYGLTGAIEDISRSALTEQFETNVFGWHELTTLCVPLMRQANEGRIIQNSSVLGLVALAHRGAYSASKYAIEALSDALRLELADTNIKVALIEPGPIYSDFRKNALAVFLKHIDWEQSVHRKSYQQQLNRLDPNNPGSKYTLPEQAVADCVLHALQHPNPKLRYPVTQATHYLRWLKRLLPERQLDNILKKIT